MRGEGRGSGQRKEARFEDGVWESETWVPGLGASAQDLVFSSRTAGRGLVSGPPAWALAGTCALPDALCGCAAGAFGLVICRGKREALPLAEAAGAPLLVLGLRLPFVFLLLPQAQL